MKFTILALALILSTSTFASRFLSSNIDGIYVMDTANTDNIDFMEGCDQSYVIKASDLLKGKLVTKNGAYSQTAKMKVAYAYSEEIYLYADGVLMRLNFNSYLNTLKVEQYFEADEPGCFITYKRK